MGWRVSLRQKILALGMTITATGLVKGGVIGRRGSVGEWTSWKKPLLQGVVRAAKVRDKNLVHSTMNGKILDKEKRFHEVMVVHLLYRWIVFYCRREI